MDFCWHAGAAAAGTTTSRLEGSKHQQMTLESPGSRASLQKLLASCLDCQEASVLSTYDRNTPYLPRSRNYCPCTVLLTSQVPRTAAS